ncbi:hypothetical protein SSX86_019077 [Deinandra increscens subsp. villosa]|uniref:ATP-dependent DNA helicase n=1 Tax=Deinandra increscens subsp. villosa TaxID=3103831 RepID=A0AAP0CWG0_9ASTR
MIVLSVASSGIASLLLPGGQTSHSRFRIPINVEKDSCCAIDVGSELAGLINEAALIIWDEAPLQERNVFEAVDRTFKDVCRTDSGVAVNRVFGGKVVVLGGDFRQILPVLPNGNRSDLVESVINSSRIVWGACKVYSLKTNMRLSSSNLRGPALRRLQEFDKWLLDMGAGRLPAIALPDETEASWITIPADLLIPVSDHPVESILSNTFPDLERNISDHRYLQERCVLCPTNDEVDEVNLCVLEKLTGELHELLSADEICESTDNIEDMRAMYSVEFLNTLRFSGIPNHVLQLKVGAPVLLLRNINLEKGLCNGTRLVVTQITRRVIEAVVISGTHIGDMAFIGRIDMTPTTTSWPFQFRRRQFPLKISDLHPNVTDKWQINVMVSRIWKSFNHISGRLLSIDMILSDEHGFSIHAKIPANVMHPFKDVFVEGSVYRIHKFVVLHYKSRYRPLRCDIFVQFIRSTTIHDSMLQSSLFTRHVFQFVPFNSLAQRENDDTYLTDVIGVLSQWGVVEKIDSVKSTNNEVRNIVILDEMGLEVSVSLWGNLARQISDDDIRNHGSPNIVIVLCSCRVRRFKGSLSVWTTASSQLYIDLPVSVLHIYKNIHVDHVVFNLANQTDVGMHITSMSQLLTDLQEGVPKGTMYNIYVNVIGVDSTNDWNYKLVLNVIESGVQASFVLFDDSAIPFVGFTVDELIEKSNLEGDDNPEWVVDFLKELLLAREAKFRIKVDDYNMAPNYVRRFTVSKLIGDHDDFPNNRTILALSDSDAVRSNDDVHVEPVIDGECAIDEEKEFHSKISEEEMGLADEALLDPRTLSIGSNSSLTMVDAYNEVGVVSPVSVSVVNEVDTRDEDTSDVVVPDVESGGSVGRSRPRRKNVKTPIRYRT